ncbi:MAG: NifB/NifX family molybdenum-iron cluster-binding protein [Acidobacteria bacterium]|jgi:predicted Fe-Mo cluster-binding NifX family protein|nr:NifB/NifX family molybdenum-iron cluster-binding protein [Acidobacteriota bacterium]
MQKLAVPVVNGRFSQHFGGADRFAIFEVDEKARKIVSSVSAVPPPHEQGSFPTWLKEQGVNTILAGGMGPRAVTMLEDFGIQVVIGVSGAGAPDDVVKRFLEGSLSASGESCHDQGFHGCHDHE